MLFRIERPEDIAAALKASCDTLRPAGREPFGSQGRQEKRFSRPEKCDIDKTCVTFTHSYNPEAIESCILYEAAILIRPERHLQGE